jgi:hypothetical protein
VAGEPDHRESGGKLRILPGEKLEHVKSFPCILERAEDAAVSLIDDQEFIHRRPSSCPPD